MNKQTFFKCALHTSLFSLFFLLAKIGHCDVIVANPPIPINDTITDLTRSNWGNYVVPAPFPSPDPGFPNTPTEMCVYLTSNDTLKVGLTVAFATQDLEYFPDIFLRYNLGGILIGDTPIIKTSDLTAYTFNGEEIYQADFTFFIDLSNDCIIPTNIFNFPIYYALMTPSTLGPFGPPMLYPVMQYTDPGELFGSDVLHLPASGDPEWQTTKSICCSGVELLMANPNNSNQADEQTQGVADKTKKPANQIEKTGTEQNQSASISANPSPFNDFLKLQISDTQEKAFDIEIIDTRGRLLTTKHISSNRSEATNINIRTADWPSGLYFIRFRSPSLQKTLKVVKN